MSRSTRVVSLSLSPEIAEVFDRIAKRLHVGKSGLFRDMVKSYERKLWSERYANLQMYGSRQARKAGVFTEKDLERHLSRGK